MNTPISSPSAFTLKPYYFAAAALAVMLLVAAIAAPWIGIGLYMTSGVWAALATDLAGGTFYRPIISETGLGGTRYFPLHFVLHAGLIRLIRNPVAAAYAIEYAAGALFVFGLYRCLTQFNVPRRFAALCAVLSLSALCVYACLFQLRPDILAAAFNLCGISFCVGLRKESNRAIAGAAVFFTLAFLTKFTTVFGLTAAVVYWTLSGRRRYAAMLAGAWVVLSGVLLLAIHIASDGRALDSFLACAAGGMTIKTLLKGSYRFFYTARIDIPFLLVFIVAFVVWIRRLQAKRWDLLALFFGLTLGATVIIAADPGAGINHFVDMQAASVLLLAVHAAEGLGNRVTRYALPASGFIGALILLLSAAYLNTYFPESRYEQNDRILALAGETGGPLLSDDPWVPILAGEKPYVLDNYLLRTMSENDPEIAKLLFTKLDQHDFRAAVLFYGKKAPRGPDRNANLESDARSRYSSWMLYPEGFYDRLVQNYAPIEFIGDYLVLLPR